MKALHSLFLLLFAAFICLRADAPPASPPPVGILILRAVAGYDAAATWFVSIQWVDKDSGYIVDKAGNKLPFLNDAIGRVIYFDQGYYDEVDHNQYWVDWRVVMRGRELVLAPIATTSLQTDESARLASEKAVMEDILQRFPNASPLIQPLIETLNDQITKLASGLVLQNGNWISAKDVVATWNSVPVVGESEAPVTFTTTDGKRFENAKVTVTDHGLSVLTSDGGASVAFDRLPKNITGFPRSVQDKITDWRVKNPPVVAVAAPPPPPPPPVGIWAWIVSTFNYAVDKTYAYFSPGKTLPDNSAPIAPAASGSIPAPAANAAAADAAVPATPDLSNTIVLIKGDYGEGTGFLTRTVSGPVVITNLHVIAGNPNLKIMTTSGQQITPLSLQGATDRDLAMFAIQDNNYKYLDLAANVDQTSAVGDPAIIPGDSEGGEVTLKTNGSLVGIGPQRVEFNNPIFHGNSGGPVVDVKTGKVVAVATGATEMAPSDDLDKQSFANANSAIKGPMRYFGLRIDTVPSWQNYDQGGFVQETLFLKSFHDESRAIDSYLNGARKEGNSPAGEEGPLDATYYMTNEKVRKADEDWHAASQAGEVSALQELVWSLGAVAGADVASVQTPSSFYPYDQGRAKYEYKYRQALITEIQRLQAQVAKPGVSASVDSHL